MTEKKVRLRRLMAAQPDLPPSAKGNATRDILFASFAPSTGRSWSPVCTPEGNTCSPYSTNKSSAKMQPRPPTPRAIVARRAPVNVSLKTAIVC